MAETGRIRKKRSKFAQISNHCLRNNKLSLRAKGLYGLIQSFIDIPDFVLYKSILQDKYCTEGRDVFNKTWKELVEAGYLKTYKINTKAGFIYEYELLDEPEEGGKEEPSNNGEVGKTSALKTKVARLSPDTENPYVGPDTEFPHVGFPDMENPTPNNTNTNYTDTKNTYSSNNNSLDNTLNLVETPSSDSVVVKKKGKSSSFDPYEEKARETEEKIQTENITYDCFDDPQYADSIYDSAYYLERFNEFHRTLPVSTLYRYRDFSRYFIILDECYREKSFSRKVEKVFADSLNSVREPSLRYAISQLKYNDCEEFLKTIENYCNPEEFSAIEKPSAYFHSAAKAIADKKLKEIEYSL